MSTVTGASGGSPRLVIVFSDGGNINLRPLAWVANAWTREGSGTTTSDWDNSGGTCGFLYEQTYDVVTACHTGTTVAAAFVVTRQRLALSDRLRQLHRQHPVQRGDTQRAERQRQQLSWRTEISPLGEV